MEHDDSLSWEKVTFSSVSLDRDFFFFLFLCVFFNILFF